MRLLILLLLPVVLFSCKKTNGSFYNSFPKVKEVVAEFDKRIHLDPDQKTYLELAKKPKGWYIVRKTKADQVVFAEYLFWNANTGHYEIPSGIEGPDPDKTAPGNDQITQALERSYQYDHQIYFGYATWADDVIADLEGGDLNDTLTESLARAYGHKSMDMTRPFNGSKRKTGFNDKEADEFMSWCDKEIATYEELQKLNPDYQTIVGNVGLKLANTNMYAWSELMLEEHPGKAAKYLKDKLYDDITISFAKNLLLSAGNDGIVFTSGDNDTYSAWYAQEKLGIRKDVAVINMSLANISQWILMWNKKYKLNLQVSEKLYSDSLSEYFLFTIANTSGETSIPELIAGIESKSDLYYSVSGKITTLTCPTKNFRLNDSGDTAEIVARFNYSQYMLRSDLVVMDIVSSNYGKRPVYFFHAAADNAIRTALGRYLVSEGMLDQIAADPGTSGSTYIGQHYNRDLLEKNLETVYTYGVKADSKANNYLVQNYFAFFNALANLQLADEDTVAAVKTLDGMNAKLFTEKTAMPNMLLLLSGTYLSAGKKTKGENLMKISLNTMKKNMAADNDQYNEEGYLRLLRYCIESAEKNNLPDVRTEALKLQEEIERRKK